MTRPEERNSALLVWFAAAARQLPWRGSTDPWHVLVAEVMLQQTPVRRVEPRFGPFLARFPEPASLAAAPADDLVVAWGGLGYLRRVFNLQAAAARIAADGWPMTPSDLRELPGVGPYTAAAVACFAFGHPVAAVDTNLRRVLSRWEGRPLAGAELAGLADRLVPAETPGAWNQAVMDLGSTLCRPQSPRCAACPVAAWCADPGVYTPPPRQGRYEGSVRQARAAVLKHLAAHGPTRRTALVAAVGLDPERVSAAVAALSGDGLIAGDDELSLR